MRRVALMVAAVALSLAAAAFSPAHAESLRDLIANFYGWSRGGLVVEKTVTCQTTPTQVFHSDPSRLWDLESDTGGNDCTLARTGALTTSNGILIKASGGSYAESWIDDGYVVGYEMWCICSGGSSTLFVQEQKAQ